MAVVAALSHGTLGSCVKFAASGIAAGILAFLDKQRDEEYYHLVSFVCFANV